MPLRDHVAKPSDETGDETTFALDRVLTRRRMLLMSGAALTPLLTACGDEEDVEDLEEQVEPPAPEEDTDLEPDEPGMDAPDTGLETPEEDDGD